jgi:hypothetical protein
MQSHAAVDDTADKQLQTRNAKASGQTAQQPSGRFPFFTDAVYDPHRRTARKRHRPMRRAAVDDLQHAVQEASAQKNLRKFRRSVHTITPVYRAEKRAALSVFRVWKYQASVSKK